MKINLKVIPIIFSIQKQTSSNYRKLDKPLLCVLLKKVNGAYKLPTLDIDQAVNIDDNITSIINDLTGLDNVYSEQLYTYSEVTDGLSIKQAYVALISGENQKIKDDCAWFTLSRTEDDNGYTLQFLNNDVSFTVNVSKKLKLGTTDRYKFTQSPCKLLAKDHGAYIIAGLERLKNKIDYTNIVFYIMPKHFTLKYLQQVYEVIKNKRLLDAAFRRTIAEKVEAAGQEKRGSGHRPSMMYKFKEN